MEYEKINSEVQNAPAPKWWHTAVRSLPGLELSPEKFAAYDDVCKNGIIFQLISITPYDPATNVPDGIYVKTNLPYMFHAAFDEMTKPLINELVKFFSKNQPPNDSQKVMEVPGRDLKVNLGTAFKLRIFSQTKSGMTYFSVVQKKIEEYCLN